MSVLLMIDTQRNGLFVGLPRVVQIVRCLGGQEVSQVVGQADVCLIGE